MLMEQEKVSANGRAYQIYALIDPRDELIHYVGVSVDAHKRYYGHLSGNVSSEQCKRWINKLKEHNLHPTLYVLEEIEVSNNSYTIACGKEQYWIEELARLGNPLLNVSGVTRTYTPFVRTQRQKRPVETPIPEIIEKTSAVEIIPMPDDELLTVDEVAHQLRVNEKTIRRWINSGILVAIKLEKEYRIAKSDLEDFKRRRRTDKKPPDKED